MSWFGPPNIEKLKAKGDISGLVKALNYKKDATVRKSAVIALGETGSSQALEPLIATLKDVNSDVRESAVIILAKIGAPAVEPLVAALRDCDGDMRQAVTKALAEIRAAAIVALRDNDEVERKRASEILDKTGWQPGEDEVGAYYWIAKQAWDRCVVLGAPAVEPLADTLNGDSKVDRRRIVDALAKIGDKRAIDALLVLLQQGAYSVDAYGAVDALRTLEWKPDQSEAAAVYWFQLGEIDKCIEIGEPATTLLIDVLNKITSGGHRMNAVIGLGKIGSARALEALLSFAFREESAEACKAIEILGDSENSQVAEILNQGLFQFYSHLATSSVAPGAHVVLPERIAALVSALGKLRYTKSFDIWIQLLKLLDDKSVSWIDGKVDDLCVTICNELVELRDPRTVESLLPLIDPGLARFGGISVGFRRGIQIIDAVATIGDRRAVEPLLRAMNYALKAFHSGVYHGYLLSPFITKSAWALVKMGNTTAVDQLIDVLGEELDVLSGPNEMSYHADKKAAAQSALKEITDQDFSLVRVVDSHEYTKWKQWWEKAKELPPYTSEGGTMG